jgi:SAM-dependent methyltransferase
MSAAQRWAQQLAAWTIPREILDQAPTSPWIHPVELFQVDGSEIADSPSHQLAREVLVDGDSVLDIGCGGGRASFALAPPAAKVYGVDHQQTMLDSFAAAAEARGLAHHAVLGDWPEVAHDALIACVAVAHHVAYNVADLAAFGLAANDHARKRVVFELSTRHPLAHLAPLWRYFWGLERPDGPTVEDALDVLREAGLPVRSTTWQEGERRPDLSWEKRIEFTRIRLCLPAERDEEIAAVLADLGPPAPRELAALWWDVN